MGEALGGSSGKASWRRGQGVKVLKMKMSPIRKEGKRVVSSSRCPEFKFGLLCLRAVWLLAKDLTQTQFPHL